MNKTIIEERITELTALLARIQKDYKRTFAVEYMRLGNAVVAIEVAYSKHGKKPLKDKYSGIQRLLKEPEIADYIKCAVVLAREKSVTDGILTYSESLADLYEMAEFAKLVAHSDEKNRVSAMNAFAKIHQVIHSMKDKPSVDEFKRLSREEVLEIVRARQPSGIKQARIVGDSAGANTPKRRGRPPKNK